MSIYETRAVLFLDILGFRDLIASRKEKEILDALIVSAKVPIPLGASVDEGLDFRVTAFSDCVVCSARILAKSNFFPAAYVAAYAGRLALELLTRGILSRGAITVGKLYHQEQTVFGPALIEAYELESRFAQYPRIIVPPKVMGQVNMTLAIRVGADWWLDHYPFREDFDGMHHLDIFGPFFIDYRPPSLKPKRANSLKAVGPATTRLVTRLCRRKFNDPRVSTKYAWMKSYLDECCSRFDWKTGVHVRNVLDKYQGRGLGGPSNKKTLGELFLSLAPSGSGA
jgi:hypothetical protein